MKITSLFSRASNVSPTTTTNDNVSTTPTSKSFASPVSSPDVIPPSPVLEKKKSNKAKRSLDRLLAKNVEINVGSTVSKPTAVSAVPKQVLDLITKSPEKPTENGHDVDSQLSSCGTESLPSTVYDETDFCSDLVFDDWLDDCSASSK